MPPAFPVPPMDLPHYHGIDLDHTDNTATLENASTKEVTGA
jgi:hypothetical protein